MTSRSPLAPSWLTLPDDANALEPQLWPEHSKRDRDGRLTIGGVDLVDVVDAYGSPLYILDRATFDAQAAALKSALEAASEGIGTSATVYYAGKAMLTGEVVQWVHAAGLSLDVASAGEMTLALLAGMPAERMGLHGNNKSPAELTAAVDAGIGTIVVDSIPEIELLAATAARAGIVQRVRLRVTTGVHASTHDYLATAREDQKFGIAIEDIDEAVKLLRRHRSLDFVGLHSHIGSQIFDQNGFVEAIDRLFDTLARLDLHLPELNLGGGFGIAYTRADDPLPIADIANGIAAAVAAASRRTGVEIPKLAFEPGRAIVGRAGITLYQVGIIKDVVVHTKTGRAIRRYVSINGGMSDNPRPELYGAEYHVALANRCSSAEPTLVRVVGMHCESGDIVVDADYLPSDVHTGDLVAVTATGAYCYVLSSNYNTVPRPAVIAIENGSAHVMVRAETFADLVRRDVVLSPKPQHGAGAQQEQRAGSTESSSSSNSSNARQDQPTEGE